MLQELSEKLPYMKKEIIWKKMLKEYDKLKVHETVKFLKLRLPKNVCREVFICDLH